MRILINPYGRCTWQIVCYSAPLHLGGSSRSAMSRMSSNPPMRVKCPAHPPRCKPGLALAGTGLSRSPGCVCVALMNRNSTFQRATRFTNTRVATDGPSMTTAIGPTSAPNFDSRLFCRHALAQTSSWRRLASSCGRWGRLDHSFRA